MNVVEETIRKITALERDKYQRELRQISPPARPLPTGPDPDRLAREMGIGPYRQRGVIREVESYPDEKIGILGFEVNLYHHVDVIVKGIGIRKLENVLVTLGYISGFEKSK